LISYEMKAKITIHGSQSVLKGDFSKSLVRMATSYPVQGYEYSKAYRSGKWDGRKHLFRPRSGAFPTGLCSAVEAALTASGVTVRVEDLRVPPTPTEAGFDLVGITFDTPYEYQLEACQTMVDAKQGVVKAATGSGKTEIACAVTQYLGLKTLFMVPSRELMYQSQRRFMKRLDLTEREVGVVGDGKWQPGSLVTIASIDTLESRMSTVECMDLIKSTEVLFLDECHGVGSDTYYTVATLCPAFYRYGLSATPLDRTDGANMMLLAATGEMIVDIPLKQLVESGVCAKGQIIFDKITEPVLKKRIQYPTAYKQGVSENPQLLKKVVEWTEVFHDQGLGVLILCEEIQHGKMIDDALWTETSKMIPHQFIHGTEDMDVRKAAIESFDKRNLPVLIASTILDQGVDVQTIDALILAGSRKSKIRTLQRLGRGLRGDKLIVVEFANFCHKYLLDHSYRRLQDYKDEECLPIHYSAPDPELVKKLWNEDD
jgi:superfamily II DNA or RNA helicase